MTRKIHIVPKSEPTEEEYIQFSDHLREVAAFIASNPYNAEDKVEALGDVTYETVALLIYRITKSPRHRQKIREALLDRLSDIALNAKIDASLDETKPKRKKV